jgi:hypothetical protein
VSLPSPQTLGGSIRHVRVDLAGGARFEGASVVGCDLGNQRVPLFQAADTTFASCDFSRIRIDMGTMGVIGGAVYRDCRFARADLARALPGVARFERCSFEGTRIDRWFGFQAEFVDCTFTGTFRTVRFYGTVGPAEIASRVGRTINAFHGNDFSQADLSDVEFVGGIDLDRQRWPTGAGYQRVDDLEARVTAARRLVGAWPASAERDAALSELATMAEVYRGQRSMFRRVGAGGYDPLWELIATAKLG